MIPFPYIATQKRTLWDWKPCCLLALFLVLLGAVSVHAKSFEEDDVIAFFQSVEDSFTDMQIAKIMANLHKDFSYTMQYRTDGFPSNLESDADEYRTNLGAFFKSKPNIYEYTIDVEEIQRSGEDIKVTARIISVVELNGIINSCDATSNYTLSYLYNKFLIKGVYGKADCTNKKVINSQ